MSARIRRLIYTGHRGPHRLSSQIWHLRLALMQVDLRRLKKKEEGEQQSMMEILRDQRYEKLIPVVRVAPMKAIIRNRKVCMNSS